MRSSSNSEIERARLIAILKQLFPNTVTRVFHMQNSIFNLKLDTNICIWKCEYVWLFLQNKFRNKRLMHFQLSFVWFADLWRKRKGIPWTGFKACFQGGFKAYLKPNTRFESCLRCCYEPNAFTCELLHFGAFVYVLCFATITRTATRVTPWVHVLNLKP